MQKYECVCGYVYDISFHGSVFRHLTNYDFGLTHENISLNVLTIPSLNPFAVFVKRFRHGAECAD